MIFPVKTSSRVLLQEISAEFVKRSLSSLSASQTTLLSNHGQITTLLGPESVCGWWMPCMYHTSKMEFMIMQTHRSCDLYHYALGWFLLNFCHFHNFKIIKCCISMWNVGNATYILHKFTLTSVYLRVPLVYNRHIIPTVCAFLCLSLHETVSLSKWT